MDTLKATSYKSFFCIVHNLLISFKKEKKNRNVFYIQQTSTRVSVFIAFHFTSSLSEFWVHFVFALMLVVIRKLKSREQNTILFFFYFGKKNNLIKLNLLLIEFGREEFILIQKKRPAIFFLILFCYIVVNRCFFLY